MCASSSSTSCNNCSPRFFCVWYPSSAYVHACSACTDTLRFSSLKISFSSQSRRRSFCLRRLESLSCASRLESNKNTFTLALAPRSWITPITACATEASTIVKAFPTSCWSNSARTYFWLTSSVPSRLWIWPAHSYQASFFAVKLSVFILHRSWPFGAGGKLDPQERRVYSQTRECEAGLSMSRP